MKQMYPTKTMYKIGNGSFSDCSFDFSIIPCDQYQMLFNAFPTFLCKKIESISFNCNFEFQYSNLGKKSKKREEIISNSIANVKPKFIEYLLKIMKIVLPKTRYLARIEFSCMQLNRKLIPRLFSILYSCPTIKNICFKNVQIDDDQFIKFIGSLSPYRIEELKFVGCGISNRSTPSILNFINKPKKKYEESRRLKKIIIDSLPIKEQNSIFRLILKPNTRNDDETSSSEVIETFTAVSESDAETNSHLNRRKLLQQIMESSSDELQQTQKQRSEEIFNELVLQQRNSISKQYEHQTKDTEYSNDTAHEYEDSTIESVSSVESEDIITDNDEQLQNQNEKLRKRLKYLMHKMNAAKFADDIFLIGPQAKELVEVIPEMKKKLANLEDLNHRAEMNKK
ncbi:hypothetical protein TVAG_126960 [Trichomonas vaginalis G3]|uniref:Uncharacterized protein n=1 Tax=Trichomonas vaginalis (strain ATCC PRA-98 / G3) TaxID=412133 RepID=A2G9W4_TRIV3|nr:RNI-like family [Trichomonas vaginalis G3]EAX86056.1 hypothetical protein TVAG_126960 [Trichomonas vaginalis G3]KAI5504457.1 RNI-like family [Trichomonas vaginalis G3]|eukprot:XP_001298986.1 hypothetical protein [Trichomonas vaginalis G3]